MEFPRASWLISGLLPALLFAGPSALGDAEDAGPSLVERLGFPADARVLILNADDYGMNHATNVGTARVLQAGAITSATIMVPCPWFPETVQFAQRHPQANLGLHLTLTSEWNRYKWGPVLGREGVPSLVDSQGYFYPNIFGVYANADLEEVRREIRAQIQKALDAGIDVTHVDSHMGTLQYNPRYHRVYLEVAAEFDLPVRMAGRELMTKHMGGFLFDVADELGVLRPDFLLLGEPETLEDTERFWKAQIASIPEGMVTEIYIHCGEETPEMEATTGTWRRRSADTDFFADPATRAWILAEGIELLSYRELRHLQRYGEPMPRVARYGWE